MPTYTSTMNSDGKIPTPAKYTANEGTQSTKQTSLKTAAKTFLEALEKNEPYLPPSWKKNAYEWTKSQKDNPPKFITSSSRGQYFHKTGTEKYDCISSWFGFRKKFWCKTRSTGYQVYTWTQNLNSNFDDEITDAKKQITEYTKQMNIYLFNDCNNPRTLLNPAGAQKCNFETALNDSYSLAQEKKQISEDTMSLIQNSDDYPQYEGAQKMNQQLIADANWNFTDKINSDYPSYNYQYNNLQNLLRTRKNFLNQSYNNCQYPQKSLTSIDNSGVPVPPCVSNPYNTAINECDKAYQMAQTYQYGANQLMGLWTDVSNAIPGNTISANGTILNNADSSCKKWVEMFNMWQKLEDEALAAPCIPERPISTQSDAAIEDIVNKSAANSKERLDAIKTRANNLIEKLKNYPNILELNKENITSAPYGMTPSVTIKNKGEFGKVPIQYLEMILPRGKQGVMGETGPVGMKGLPGKPGPVGKEGPAGNPTLPF